MRGTLESLRRQVRRYPRKPKSRVMSWIMPILAASIAWIALTTCFWAIRAPGGRSGRSSASHDDVAAAFTVDLPMAKAFTKAAGQSSQALDALLDLHAREAASAQPLLLARANVSPLESVHAGAMP